MCGIAGVLYFDGRSAERDQIERMVGKVAHRGPDGEGFECRGRLALGHRRLSIVDVDMGQQPMFNEDREVAVVFNGEIYNHLELRQLLEVNGHRFRTRCDTEVLVHAWEEWGKGCVERLRGMFAFAIADWKKGVVFLARDHFGIKPLYYTVSQKYLAFSSELQALRVLPEFPCELSLESIDRYLSLGYIPAPHSVYAKVAKLAPATRLLIHFDGRMEPPELYWRLEYRPEDGRSIDEWAEGLESVIRESVRAHLMSDVPFGAFLSGGLDSTAVVTFMADQLGYPVKTFSIGFEDERYNELPYAESVAKRLSTDHHTEIVRPEATAILPQLVEHYGEPFGDSSAVPTYFISRLARRHVPMVLSGDGGDEALGGYGKYSVWLRPTDPKPWRPWWKRLLRPMLSGILPRRYPPDPLPRRPRAANLFSINQNITAAWRRRLWREEYHPLLDFASNPFDRLFLESAGWAPLSQAQYADYSHYLPNDILTKVDVASMMHGLEVRTPFVDLRVVEFAAKIPSVLHVARNRHGRWETKRLLKRVLGNYYESDFVSRRKQGFAMPISRWFEADGSMRNQLGERIATQDAHITEYLRPEAVRALLSEHERRGDHGRPLWFLLFLEAWLEMNKPGK